MIAWSLAATEAYAEIAKQQGLGLVQMSLFVCQQLCFQLSDRRNYYDN